MAVVDPEVEVEDLDPEAVMCATIATKKAITLENAEKNELKDLKGDLEVIEKEVVIQDY